MCSLFPGPWNTTCIGRLKIRGNTSGTAALVAKEHLHFAYERLKNMNLQHALHYQSTHRGR